MNWVSLGPLQVAALWAVAGAAALYLYRRSRLPVKRNVSTLRFWVSDNQTPPSRRLLREPWSLVAQLLFLLFVILALAGLRLGEAFESRSVVIVVDTSVWSRAQPPGEPDGLERERREARRFLDALPAADRVLLLRTDADVTSVLPFTTDRTALGLAIASLEPSSAVADVPRAVEMALAAVSGSRRGLVVYVGPGMLDERQVARLDEIRQRLRAPGRRGHPPQLLARLVKGTAPGQNRGITSIALQRDPARPEQWQVLTKLKNYSQTATRLVLTLSVDGQPLGQRSLALGPSEAADVRERVVVPRSGLLEATLGPPDWLDADDRAAVFVPAFRPIRVRVIAAHPAFARRLRGVLDANPYVHTDVAGPDAGPTEHPPDISIYEGVPVPAEPAPNSIWFVSGSKGPASGPVRLAAWNTQHPVTRWVRTRDVSVRYPASLQAQADDTVLASGTNAEPLVLARDRKGEKSLVVGFDPANSNFPEQAAFPLLMAGAMEWMTPPVNDTARSFPTGELDVPGPVTRVTGPSNRELPFVRDGRSIQLLALETGVYRLGSPDGERLLPVNVPALPSRTWKPTPQELAAVEPDATQDESSDLWRWLVALGFVAVWAEWRLFQASK